MTSFAVREDRLLQLSEDLKGLVEKTVSGVNNETYSPKAKELRHNLKAAADPDRIQGVWGAGGRGGGVKERSGQFGPQIRARALPLDLPLKGVQLN